MTEQNIVDDGTLACLNIPRDENDRSFNCDETTQSKIVNTSFWLVDFLEDVPTRFSKTKGSNGQTLVMIKPEKDSPNSMAKKYFTGSAQQIHILQWLRQNNKFPRKVTLRGSGNRYWFE